MARRADVGREKRLTELAQPMASGNNKTCAPRHYT